MISMRIEKNTSEEGSSLGFLPRTTLGNSRRMFVLPFAWNNQRIILADIRE